MAREARFGESGKCQRVIRNLAFPDRAIYQGQMRIPGVVLISGFLLFFLSACQSNGGGSTSERLGSPPRAETVSRTGGESSSRPATEAPARAAPEVLHLREDMRLMQARMAEMENNLEEMMRRNVALQSRLRELENNLQGSMEQNFATVSQLERVREELRTYAAEEGRRSRRESITEATRLVEDLSRQTQAALDTLARSINTRPTGGGATTTPRQFSEDFPREGVTHVVARGETLSGIAQRYGSSVRDIQNANRIDRPETIQVGQTLFIPIRD